MAVAIERERHEVRIPRGSQARTSTKDLPFAYHWAISAAPKLAANSLSMPAMMLDQQTKYPSRRTKRAEGPQRRETGRAGRGWLENIVTGRQREFASGEELLDSIANDLEAAANEPSIQAEGA